MTRSRVAAWVLLTAWVLTPVVHAEDEHAERIKRQDLVESFLTGNDDSRAYAEAEIRKRKTGCVELLRRVRPSVSAQQQERIDRLLRRITTDWQRARTPKGMVYVPAGALEVPRVKAPWGPSGTRVQVAAFYIDKTEVSVADWRAYLAWRTSQGEEPSALHQLWRPPADVPDTQPCANVRWVDAKHFAEAFRKGVLPTAEQFERALRGSGVAPWPWGAAPPKDRANLRDTGPGAPWAVGSVPAGASAFGVLDLVGNLAEWSATEVAQGRVGRYPLVLGGSFRDRPSTALTWRGKDRMRARVGPRERREWIGFRVAQPAPKLP